MCSLEMASFEPSTPFGWDSSSSNDKSLPANIRSLSGEWRSLRVVYICSLRLSTGPECRCRLTKDLNEFVRIGRFDGNSGRSHAEETDNGIDATQPLFYSPSHIYS